jgi:hypothetical protein
LLWGDKLANNASLSAGATSKLDALNSGNSFIVSISHHPLRFPIVNTIHLLPRIYATGYNRWLRVTAKSRIDRPTGRLSP